MIRKEWMIALQHISFQRDKHLILDDISLQISNKDFILMTGQNGSGKSTLLRIIAGLLKPATADISIADGKGRPSCSWLKSRNRLRQRICYLHQQPYLFHGTVFDNVAFGLRQKKVSRQQINERVNQALQTFSLQDLINRDCRELSGGEKQRVAIVRSWIIKPDIILLDEPFANMDKESRLQLYVLINQLQRDDIAVVLTSHDPQKGSLNFNKHLHLYQGKMVPKKINKNTTTLS